MLFLGYSEINAIPWLPPPTLSAVYTRPPPLPDLPGALLTFGTLGCSMCEQCGAGNQTGHQA